MKIVFLSHYFYPHIGGVEKHVYQVSKSLILKGHKVTVITEKYLENLKDSEVINGIRIERFIYPKIKFLGLIFIWIKLFKYRKEFSNADVIHCHDVFIWYLPYKFILSKNVFTTFHGWEGVYPIPLKNIVFKKIANTLSSGTIAVGEYIEKYYHLKANKIIYGGKN